MTSVVSRSRYAADIARAQLARDRAAAKLAAADAELQALIGLMREQREAVIEALHDSHSDGTISPMQANSEHSLGVRIAGGRADQSASRKAQIAANLTDKEVADLTGYNRSTVCKWHNGSMKVPEEARKLLAKRGIPASSWTKR